MPLDPEYLRQHYASLSDDSLLEIDRGDLVEIEQRCYDDEVEKRQLLSPGGDFEQAVSESHTTAHGRHAHDDPPDWLDEGSEVYGATILPGLVVAPEIDQARASLEAEGIPCFVDILEDPPEPGSSSRPASRWRVLVPGDLNLHASSVLERDMLNTGFVNGWKHHLEMLSDEDLRETRPEVVFCGLYDRIARVVRAYKDELSRRGIPSP